MVATDVRRTILGSQSKLADREVSIRGGLYSLDLILYEMFSGKRAFEDPRDGVTPPSLKKAS